jgi:hypothetical protein
MTDDNNPRMKRPPISADHNGGPPLDDEHVPEWGDGEAAAYFQWKAAVHKARKTTSYDIMMFRLSRAEAAGVDYDTYVTEILERGNYLQVEDIKNHNDLERIRNRWKDRPRVMIKSL